MWFTKKLYSLTQYGIVLHCWDNLTMLLNILSKLREKNIFCIFALIRCLFLLHVVKLKIIALFSHASNFLLKEKYFSSNF